MTVSPGATTPPSPAISRRLLLGGTGAALALAACTNEGAPSEAVATTSAPSTDPDLPEGEDIVAGLLEKVGIDAPLGLSLVTFSPDVLSGKDRSFTFGLIDAQQNAAPGLDVQVWFVAPDGETVAGPFDPTFYPAETPALTQGAYHTQVTLEGSGTYDVVVATRDDSVAGTGAQQVRGPSQALVTPPGAPLPLAQTPTVDDPKNLQTLCTREPDCTMHAKTVQEIIESGRHLVLTIATPAFCSTDLCGPTVSIVEQIKNDTTRDDVDFVHVEVYIDEGNTPTDYVTQLNLPSEPWTFVVDGNGLVVERYGGPVIPEVIGQVIADLPTLTSSDAPTDDATASDDATATPTASESASG